VAVDVNSATTGAQPAMRSHIPHQVDMRGPPDGPRKSDRVASDLKFDPRHRDVRYSHALMAFVKPPSPYQQMMRADSRGPPPPPPPPAAAVSPYQQMLVAQVGTGRKAAAVQGYLHPPVLAPVPPPKAAAGGYAHAVQMEPVSTDTSLPEIAAVDLDHVQTLAHGGQKTVALVRHRPSGVQFVQVRALGVDCAECEL
jgi:hypothetical protein